MQIIFIQNYKWTNNINRLKLFQHRLSRIEEGDSIQVNKPETNQKAPLSFHAQPKIIIDTLDRLYRGVQEWLNREQELIWK